MNQQERLYQEAMTGKKVANDNIITSLPCPSAECAATGCDCMIEAHHSDTEPVDEILIEIQDLIGPQDGTGYQEWTGPLGRHKCGKCGHNIIAAKHHLRPDGERPVLLQDYKTTKGNWRAYTKNNEPYAQFAGIHDPISNYHNHRIICPEAHA